MATAKLYNLKNLKNIEFLGIAPSKEKHIETITNYLSFKEFMEVSNQYKTILDIGTYMYLKDTYNNKGISKLSNLYSDSIIKISSFYGGIVDRYRQFMYLQKIESVGKTKELYEEIYSICKENNIWNFEIKDMVDMHSDTLEKLWTVVEPFIISTYSGNTIKENSYLLIADYLLARGVIRPNENLVRELNSNPYYINIKNRKK